MSDDIVTRLRENCGCSGGEEFGYNCTNCDAADEIELLRGQLSELSRLADVGAIIPTNPYPKHKIKWWQR